MKPFSGTYVEAIRQALFDAMEADPSVCCIGEDIGAYGGAFKATEGLLSRFGPDRVIDTPISEQAIAGAAIGAALMGQRPVAEFQFKDFALRASDRMVKLGAKARWRWGASVPAGLRGPGGGGPVHTPNPQGPFLGSPGLKVGVPGTLPDAYALLRAAIEDPDPVLVFEPKHLYRRLKDAWDEAPMARLGEAALRKDGGSACIITYGAAQHMALEAVADLDVAVLDLRSLWPLDDLAIADLARRTHRVLVLTEASTAYGPGAELAARIGETCFSWLDAPVLRLGALDTPTPASPPLEAAFLPGKAAIRASMERLLAW